jgi:Iron-binding zinc finger CDGSH type
LEPAVDAERNRRWALVTEEGPAFVHGPSDVVLPDGRTVSSDRAVRPLCTCRRSYRYALCDTAHRRRVREDRRD